MNRLKEALLLSDKGYKDLKKAIVACTITNITMILPFMVTVMVFREILLFFAEGSINYNRIWFLYYLTRDMMLYKSFCNHF